MPSSSIYPLDVCINIRHARICRWRWRMIWLAISLLCPFCLSIEFHLQLKPAKKDVHSHASICITGNIMIFFLGDSLGENDIYFHLT